MVTYTIPMCHVILVYNKKSGNLEQEIAALAEINTSNIASTSSSRLKSEPASTSTNLKAKKVPKMKKSRDKLVEEFRISVSIPEKHIDLFCQMVEGRK